MADGMRIPSPVKVVRHNVDHITCPEEKYKEKRNSVIPVESHTVKVRVKHSHEISTCDDQRATAKDASEHSISPQSDKKKIIQPWKDDEN